MNITLTEIPGVMVVETKIFDDKRGSFGRLFCEHDISCVLGERRIVQINHSRTSTVGAVRGLHFQHPPHAEMKMVRCLRGRVLDIALDLRKDSPTFLCWHAQELSPHNALMLVIPEGFAHGFQVLEPNSELLYLHTASYMPSCEGGVRYDDPALKITWPLPVTVLSERDRQHPLINKNFFGVSL